MKKTDKIAKLLIKERIPFPYFFFQMDETSNEEYDDMLIRSFKSQSYKGYVICQSNYKKHISRVLK